MLAETFPVRLAILSKSERGVALTSGDSATAVRAVAPLTTGLTVDEAIGAAIGSCVTQFIGNWPAFDAGNGTEPVHQMRVAMRRLRSLLALFQRAFPCAEFATFRAEAKRIATAMEGARNWDVFAHFLRDGPLAALPAEAGFDELLAAADRRREAGYASVGTLLADAATPRFVLAMQAFAARRGWRNALPGTKLPQLTVPASNFAAACLDRLHRRVRRRGRRLLDPSPAERHQLRIALKKLRYAADTFAALCGDHTAVRAYIRATAKLQDALGRFNDMQITADLARQLDGGGDLDGARAIGIMIGWCGHGRLAGDAELRTAWEKFRKATPFWSASLPAHRPASPG